MFQPLVTHYMNRVDKLKYLKAKRINEFSKGKPYCDQKDLSYADMFRKANNVNQPIWNPEVGFYDYEKEPDKRAIEKSIERQRSPSPPRNKNKDYYREKNMDEAFERYEK